MGDTGAWGDKHPNGPGEAEAAHPKTLEWSLYVDVTYPDQQWDQPPKSETTGPALKRPRHIHLTDPAPQSPQYPPPSEYVRIARVKYSRASLECPRAIDRAWKPT